MTANAPMPNETPQRLDRWLWHARFFKTRALAAKTVGDKGCRLTRNGQTLPVQKPGFQVRPGDQIAFTRGERLFVIEVTGIGERRGPASEAQTLYIDHSPPPPPRPDFAAPTPAREKGAGRPTKKDRRELNRFSGE